jgi:hypothetical protein
MVNVTDKAHEALVDYFKEKGTASPVRIFLAQGG